MLVAHRLQDWQLVGKLIDGRVADEQMIDEDLRDFATVIDVKRAPSEIGPLLAS